MKKDAYFCSEIFVYLRYKGEKVLKWVKLVDLFHEVNKKACPFFPFQYILMRPKYVFYKYLRYSKKILDLKSARNFWLDERGKKYIWKPKIVYFRGLFSRLTEISGQKYFRIKNFEHFPLCDPKGIKE